MISIKYSHVKRTHSRIKKNRSGALKGHLRLSGHVEGPQADIFTQEKVLIMADDFLGIAAAGQLHQQLILGLLPLLVPLRFPVQQELQEAGTPQDFRTAPALK
jgi:hypothetical protein